MSQNIILNKKYGITLSVLDNGLGIVHNNKHEKIYLNKDMSGFRSYYDGSPFNISSIPKVFNIDKVENMYQAFSTKSSFKSVRELRELVVDSIIGSPFCGDNVTDMRYAYSGCINLTGSPVCGNNVTNMYSTYYNCRSLTGSPVCGDNVTSMYGAYSDCTNLTGSPVCGNNVTNMSGTYYSCTNLTGSPVCGNNVTDMAYAYDSCSKLAGSPVCGNNVTNMVWAYSNCKNLTGSPICGENVTSMYYAYYNCPNLYGDMYCYNATAGSISMYYCFYGRNKQNRLNIHVVAGSKFDTTLHIYTGDGNIYGASLTWTDDSENHCYYNADYNTWVYNNL